MCWIGIICVNLSIFQANLPILSALLMWDRLSYGMYTRELSTRTFRILRRKLQFWRNWYEISVFFTAKAALHCGTPVVFYMLYTVRLGSPVAYSNTGKLLWPSHVISALKSLKYSITTHLYMYMMYKQQHFTQHHQHYNNDHDNEVREMSSGPISMVTGQSRTRRASAWHGTNPHCLSLL